MITLRRSPTLSRSPVLAIAAMFLAAAAPHSAAVAQAPLGHAAAREVTVTRGAANPAVSPDGESIAFSVLGKLWVVPVSGGTATQVTRGSGWDDHPAWSPDGGFLMFARSLPTGSQIVELNRATGAERLVQAVDAGVGPIAYHPDGSEIFYVRQRSQYDAHVWRAPRDAGQPTQLTFTENWHEWSFAVSPSGDSLFLESGRYGGADLYMLALDSLSGKRLTRTPAANEMQPTWSRDGSRRVWVVGRNGMDTVVVQDGGGEPRPVHASPYGQKQMAIAPSGRFAVVADGRRLYRIDLDEGGATEIPFSATFRLPERAPGNLAIVNARVWTGVDDEVIEDAVVEVRDGRIVSVGSGTRPAGDLPVIDAEGMTLLPGFIDNHAHYWSPFAGERHIERGVTSIRDPGAPVSSSMSYKDANRLGIVLGPDIYTAGPLIDGPGGYHPMVDVAIADPAAAPALVRALKEQGVDLLKVYFLLDPDVVRAVLAEAERQGLPVTGHIGVRTSLREAIDAGIDGLSHIRVWRDMLPLDVQPQGENESLDSSRNPVARMQADWSDIDPDGPEIAALLRHMAANGTALDATLTVQRIGDRHRERFGIEEMATAQQSYLRMARFVRNAHEAGVMLLAGTDGGSLFDEMEAYQVAGVPPVAVLQSATINGARWLGMEGEFGSIRPGRRAHMVLVDGDPLTDVSEARNIEMVIKDGRVVVSNR